MKGGGRNIFGRLFLGVIMMYKYSKNQNTEIKKAVKSFNEKIKRLSKKPQYKEILPDKITISEIKSSIGNKRDYTYELNRLKNFLKKDAQLIETHYGERMLRYSFDQAKKDMARANRMRKSVLNRIPPQPQKYGITTNLGASLTAVEPYSTRVNRNWKAFATSLRKSAAGTYYDKKAENYRNQWLNMFMRNHTQNENTMAVIQALENLSPLEFYQLTQRYNKFSFREVYLADFTGEGEESYEEQILDILEAEGLL